MPDPAEKKELGGLARSIDSLFTERAGRTPERDEEDPPSEGGPQPQPGAAGVVGVATSAVEEGVVEEVEPAVSGSATAPPPLPEEETRPATDEPPLSAPPPLPSAEVGGGGPPALEVAVESYLRGSADADRIRTLASAHALALEFEPIASAVERLVLGASEPPDSETARLLDDLITPIVIGRVVKRLGHERDEERRAAYHRICSRLGLPMAEAIRDELAEESDRSARRAYFDALVAMGERARSVVEAMAEDENRFLARNGVAILGTLGGPRAAELVVAALANTDPRVRREGLLQMARLEIEDAEPLVLGLLEDSDEKVRLAAAFTAGELRIERAVRPLLAMLDASSDAQVVLPVLHALGRIGDPGAVPSIEKRATRDLFGKPPTDVRVGAYQALAQIGTPHARGLLEKAVDDKDPIVRRVARNLVRSS